MTKEKAMSGVYLLHFERWVGGDGREGALHYVGWSDNIPGRMALHRRRGGSKLMKYIKRNGIGWKLVRVWSDASRDDERRLKNGGHFADLCPVCSGRAAAGRRAYGYEIVTFESEEDAD